MKQLDLKFGHPEFMKQFWSSVGNEQPSDHGPLNYFRYPVTDDKLQDSVKNYIRSFHEKAENLPASVYEHRLEDNLILANGATQLINAVFMAYKILYNIALIHSPNCQPEWAYFPHIATQNGLKYIKQLNKPESESAVMTFIASPNNPMMTMDDQVVDVMDGCYRWPLYVGDKCKMEDSLAKVHIFSFAKATGFAGLRFGWAFVEDQALAEKIREILEFQTCGTSTASLTKVHEIFRRMFMEQRRGGQVVNEMWSVGKSILDARQNIVQSVAPNRAVNNAGMFSVIKLTSPEYYSLDVIGQKVAEDQYRFNIGCGPEMFEEFWIRLRRLK